MREKFSSESLEGGEAREGVKPTAAEETAAELTSRLEKRGLPAKFKKETALFLAGVLSLLSAKAAAGPAGAEAAFAMLDKESGEVKPLSPERILEDKMTRIEELLELGGYSSEAREDFLNLLNENLKGKPHQEQLAIVGSYGDILERKLAPEEPKSLPEEPLNAAMENLDEDMDSMDVVYNPEVPFSKRLAALKKLFGEYDILDLGGIMFEREESKIYIVYNINDRIPVTEDSLNEAFIARQVIMNKLLKK